MSDITYTWKILDCERDAKTGVITVAHWDCTGSDGVNSDRHYEQTVIAPAPENVAVKPFEQVSEEDVISWLFLNGVDREEIEARIAAAIECLKNPVCEHGVPWSVGK